jgi:hypothetical protein
VGRLATLQHLYRQRFVQHSARYVEWVSLPLAVAGVSKLRGFVGRFLASWAIVTVLGVGLGLATARFPPDRFVTFGYVVPLLAAIGAVRLWRSLRRKRAVATALVVVVLLAMMLGTFFAWRREKPYINLSETASVTTASRWIESTSEGTPLYFVVESGDSSITFFATQAANTIRAAVPPDRIRDVHVLVPPGNARPGSERDVLSRSTYAAEAHDLFTPSRWMLEFELRPFDAPVFGTVLPPNVRGTLGPGLPNPLAHPSSDVWIYSPKAALPAPAATAMDPLQPSSPGLIAFATLLCLAALGLSGMGWARAAGLDTTAAAATSPAFGFAALALIAIGLERLGLPLSGSIGPSVVALVAVSGSYVALQISKRQSVQEPPPQVDEG